MKKALAVLVTVILALCLFVSCEEGSSTPAEYTLTFKTSGSRYEKTVSAGSYILPNATSVTRGLSPVFRGWQIDGETEIREAGDIITVSSDMTLTARYKDDCKVTVKDGESVVAEDHLIYGERYTLPSALEKKGYSFLGWKVGEKTLAAGEKITVTADTTIEASWIESYTCLVDYNYKEYREVYAVDKGTQVRISDWDITTLAEDYSMTFLGWYLNGEKYLKTDSTAWGKTVTIEKNSVMTAIWAGSDGKTEATYHTVTFEDYYGTDSDLKVMILKGNTVYLPDEMNPEEGGKTFLGWYNGETKFDFSKPITANTELTAKFDPNVTVTFYSDNGTPWGVTSQSVTKTYGSTIEEKALAKSKPNKDGCEFAGWYNGAEKFEFDVTTVTANVTYTAKWNCTVTFINTCGDTEHDEKVAFAGSTVEAPATNPTTTELYKTFAYWSLSKDGEEYDFSTPLTKSITLYAVWRDYKVGDTGPAGGYIIYAKDSVSDGWRYLESARNDLNGEYKFGWYGTPSGTDSEEIGAGKSNTEKLIKGDGDAAKAAKNCREGGYADWFLPSYKELKLMYKYRNEIGNFSATRYWSSTGYDNGSRYAFCIEFVNRSYTDEKFRSGTWSVRPVRQF